MSQSVVKNISINQLRPGMIVKKIIEQNGSVKVTSSGRVSSEDVIQALKKKGVKKLQVELPRQDGPASANVSSKKQSTAKTTFAAEIVTAEKLHRKGKYIQKVLLNAVSKGLAFDEQIPREFSQQLVASMDRNPDALLCLTKIKEKDDYLLEHSLNVAIILANFARHIGMDNEAIQELAYAGFLHDLGKIQIDDAILHKPGRLTDVEMEEMKKHVTYGVEALKSATIAPHLIRVVSEHHERLDGRGYPLGKQAEDISQDGRMLAIADMFDALTADRCYKAGMSSQKAIKILLSEAPERLDKALLDQFIKCMGVFPVGSLVKLSNQKLAMVLKQNASLAKPVVKVFYSLGGNHFLEPKDIDLSTDDRIHIEQAVVASDYNIDFNTFFHRMVQV
ncbi:HD-GYP domain-containing protein [Salinimonas sp. HHU 13199]|uniref:HD-GYP domain-containing protein n=1 Tax=Salinimonas profundi TaxID=2729140 RepID=A0ABR8LJ56_9ALTE|nr:HD-GYP domain-containing protein [Salinimonas profundi]MBD3585787.1 HD-GYP domain-containing protein [Salinimonas profundi]